ncbi:protein LPA3-like [Rosa sericea]
MPISDTGTASRVPFAIPSLPSRQVATACKYLPLNSYGNLSTPKWAASHLSRNLKLVASSASGDDTSVAFDVSIPRDYDELLEQASKATQLALKDNKQLMEIEFPTAGLDSVPGDGEGGIEMTGSIQLIREFCDILISPEKATRTRIFFPEANEVEFARKSAFEGASFKLDYLTKPSFFEDFGFTEKVKMTDRVKPEDELFLAAYPYFNVSEMLVVEELYREAVVNTSRKLIIFNGELDRIRSGYYPSFFYPKLAALLKTLFPSMETVYYIHNFKGRSGGTLFRCYPGPWKVFRKVRNRYICLHQQEAMPSLKEVALEILPSA